MMLVAAALLLHGVRSDRACGRRGPFAGGAAPYRAYCMGDREPPKLRENCLRPEVEPAQAAWLDAAESSGALLRDYWRRVYGGDVPSPPAAARATFFWDSVPNRTSFAAQWSCYQCPKYGYLAPGRLWAPVEEAKVAPAMLTDPELRAQCVSGKGCGGKRLWRDLERGYGEPRLRFPGFFVQRYDPARLDAVYVDGVPDGRWVEVLRVSRLETKRAATEVCSRGQVWFWRAAGSGVWLDVGKSLRRNATDGAHAESCADARRAGYDTIQLLRSFHGYSYEILDCRGADLPRSREVWTDACPPDHVPLRWGLPVPRHAPQLDGADASWGGPCACDARVAYANCGAAPPRPCDLDP